MKKVLFTCLMLLTSVTFAQQMSIKIRPVKSMVPGITTGTQHQVVFSWSGGTTGAGVTYNVYRGVTAGGEGTTPYAQGITAMTFTDTSVTNGLTYFYYVTVVLNKDESAGSNEINALIPTNPTPPVLTLVSVQ